MKKYIDRTEAKQTPISTSRGMDQFLSPYTIKHGAFTATSYIDLNWLIRAEADPDHNSNGKFGKQKVLFLEWF